MKTGAALFDASVVVIKNESSVVVVTMLNVPVMLPLPVPLNALIVGLVNVLFVRVCEPVNVATVESVSYTHLTLPTTVSV